MKAFWNKHWPLFATALIIAICWAVSVYAAGPIAHLSWTLPTQNVDSTPVVPLKETLIRWNRTGDTAALNGSVRVAIPATAVDVPGLICGDYDFYAVAVPVSGTVSDPSNIVVYKTAVVCSNKPNPPGALTAQ